MLGLDGQPYFCYLRQLKIEKAPELIYIAQCATRQYTLARAIPMLPLVRPPFNKYTIFCGERNNFPVFAVIYHP